MKRPLTLLGISVLLIIVGSAVCMPGICGCVSWLGIPDSRYNVGFMWFYLAGLAGLFGGIVWLIIAAARIGARRDRHPQE